jgi:hypothetical protein
LTETNAVQQTVVGILPTDSSNNIKWQYKCAPVCTGNMCQYLPRLRETTDNTERYI